LHLTNLALISKAVLAHFYRLGERMADFNAATDILAIDRFAIDLLCAAFATVFCAILWAKKLSTSGAGENNMQR
jgi:hypothetical protein